MRVPVGVRLRVRLWLWLSILSLLAAAASAEPNSDRRLILHAQKEDKACHDHGQSDGHGGCTCDKFWSGKHCGKNYLDVIGSAAWGGLVYTTCSIQGLIVLLTLYQFICRYMCYLTPQRPRFTFRDTTALLNALGSISRIVWFISTLYC